MKFVRKNQIQKQVQTKNKGKEKENKNAERGWIRHVLHWRHMQANGLLKHEVDETTIEMEWRVGFWDGEKWSSSLTKNMFEKWIETFKQEENPTNPPNVIKYIDYTDAKNQRFRLNTNGSFEIIQKKRWVALPYVFMRHVFTRDTHGNDDDDKCAGPGLRLCITKEEKQQQEMFDDHAETYKTIRIATRHQYSVPHISYITVDATQVYQPYTDETTYHIEIEVHPHPFHLEQDACIAQAVWQWMDHWMLDRVLFPNTLSLNAPSPLVCIGIPPLQ